jgi:hypothetical protein
VNVFNSIVSVVLVLATLATVWFARQAARDGRKAADAAADTVTKAGEIAEATRDTVSELRRLAEHSRNTVAEHARCTVKIARQAAAADERDRQLRDIAGIIETIFYKASLESGDVIPEYRYTEQNQLTAAVIAHGQLLPRCNALGTMAMLGEAAQARQEVQLALQALNQDPA